MTNQLGEPLNEDGLPEGRENVGSRDGQLLRRKGVEEVIHKCQSVFNPVFADLFLRSTGKFTYEVSNRQEIQTGSERVCKRIK